MAQLTNEVKQMNTGGARVRKRNGSALLLALSLTALIMGGAYSGLCAWAGSRTVFYPNETISGIAVGGLSVEQAAQALSGALPGQTITVSSAQAAEDEGWIADPEPAVVSLAELGYTTERCPGIAQRYFEEQQAIPFFSRGARVLSLLTNSGQDGLTAQDRDEDVFQENVALLAENLTVAPLSGTYDVRENEILLTREANGRSIGAKALAAALEGALAAGNREAGIEFVSQSAEPLDIRELHETLSGEMQNARYDAATGEIIPEVRGVSFDTASAQRVLSAAAPGETVSIPADIQNPEITAGALKAVLFRDLLGECTTHVGGTAARISNVRLASAAFDGTVLNSGDVFSYNETVGQRTAAKGYKPAPAYVQGETVDEIGGGVCQPSSTLYYACLLANMEITQRYAHRYIPNYITRGMDATVSWGGPDYKFTNNTDYPIKIETVYEKGYLTVRILGTNLDGTYVKMTYEQLSSTPFEVVYEDDPALAPGEEVVKVTPYTGYKGRTYRNVYAADGSLISSEYEDTSDYKVRNRVILRGPAVEQPSAPVVNPTPGDITVDFPPAETDPGALTEPPLEDPGMTPPIIVLPEGVIG